MPECTSTGCRRERLSRFFASGAVRRLTNNRMQLLTHLGIHNSAAQLYYICECHQTPIESLSGQQDYPLPSCMAWHSSQTPRESTLARPSPLELDCLRVHLVRVLFGLPFRSLDCSRPTARRVLLFRSSVRAPLASAARTVMRPGLASPGTSVAASLVVPAPVT